jgi:hypothetical protein
MGRGNLKKIIIGTVAAAFVGGLAMKPMPASALIPLPFMYAILQSKQDKNFKAVNPYAAKATRKRSKGKSKKRM